MKFVMLAALMALGANSANLYIKNQSAAEVSIDAECAPCYGMEDVKKMEEMHAAQVGSEKLQLAQTGVEADCAPAFGMEDMKAMEAMHANK